jgi:hypothetical protein
MNRYMTKGNDLNIILYNIIFKPQEIFFYICICICICICHITETETDIK